MYQERRRELLRKIPSGLVLLAANYPAPRNYAAACYPFRQDSTFLYYTGIKRPACYLVLDTQSGQEFLAGEEAGPEDIIWSGSTPGLAELAEQAGIGHILSLGDLQDTVRRVIQSGGTVHYLDPYSGERKLRLSEMVDIPVAQLASRASQLLAQAVIEQRQIKTREELLEIEQALNKATGPMHRLAMQLAQPGRYEYELVAAMQSRVAAQQMQWAYPPICSIRGEVLHNETHTNCLQEGQLLLVDAGAESPLGYASDITRTTPVGGRFSMLQREIYEIVLRAQQTAMEAIAPGIPFRDAHFRAARALTEGLIQLGLMKGSADEAVGAGAHTLFFMHGIGHMMGLDVHDMEDLGTHRVGFDREVQPVAQFGTANLRLGKRLETGYVVTVEPGIYFNPVLINQWQAERKWEAFINYSKLSRYEGFGGIRIEDNVTVTPTGHKLLGHPIPKTIADIERMVQEAGEKK